MEGYYKIQYGVKEATTIEEEEKASKVGEHIEQIERPERKDKDLKFGLIGTANSLKTQPVAQRCPESEHPRVDTVFQSSYDGVRQEERTE